MIRFLTVVATVLLSATLIMFALAIWTGDTRWAQMALLSLFPGMITALIAGGAKALD